MTILPEAITTKFTELFDAINYATDDLKLDGAEANLNGDFSQVVVINDTCQKLQALEADIKSVLNSFEAQQKKCATIKSTFPKNADNDVRKPSSRLRVRVADKVIEERTAADTFVKVLKAFGFDRVAKLNKVVSGIPLLAKTSTNSDRRTKQCEDWYIATHSNTQVKKELLVKIGKELNIPIQIEVVAK